MSGPRQPQIGTEWEDGNDLSAIAIGVAHVNVVLTETGRWLVWVDIGGWGCNIGDFDTRDAAKEAGARRLGAELARMLCAVHVIAVEPV